MHAEAPDFDDFVASVKAEFPDLPFRTGYIGAVIGAHGGPGIMGITFLTPM